MEGEFYHKGCFRCTQGGCFLTPSNYAALDGNLFCKPHFSQLFKEKGSYNHLKQAVATIKKAGATSSEDAPTDDQEPSKTEEEPPTEEAAAEEEESQD